MRHVQGPHFKLLKEIAKSIPYFCKMDVLKDKTRIDKYLWAVRLFKTRALAAEACDKGRVRISDLNVKAGKAVKCGETIVIHRGPWHQHIRVLALSEKRMSATLVKEFYEDITPPEETERLKLHQAAMSAWNVKSGSGRPTKKDRRQMDDFLGDW